MVVGIRSDSVRSRLLREAELTLQKAIDICRAAEVTDSRMASIKSSQDKYLGKDNKYSNSRQRDNKTKRISEASQQSKVLCKYCGNKHLRDKNKCPPYGKLCKNQDKPIHDTGCSDLFIGTLTEINDVTASNDEWNLTLQIEGKAVKVKLDTGAKCNVLPKSIYNTISPSNKIIPTNTKLIAYSGDTIDVVHDSKNHQLKFYVIDRPTQAILGLKDCERLNLIRRVQHLEQNCSTADDFLKKYSDVFTTSEVGCLPGLHHIKVDKNAKPVIDSPRRVPATLRQKIKSELDRMESIGVVSPVKEPTDWVSSMVPVVRPDKLRVCIDPFNLNQAIKREHHPMKTIEEVASRLPGAKIFSTLDAASGFWQIQLNEESANLTCFNTPFGRYKFNRMPFGITSAPEVFQRTMELLFEDIDGCEIIVDDILVWGRNEEEHDRRLVDVLERARKINLKLRKEKCKIKTEKLLYIGHQLTANGLQPDVEKVAAITGMPEPTCKKDVQRFIGMIQSLAKFIPNLSEKAQPLRNLLKKDAVWQRNHEQQKAFQDLQQACCEPPLLKYYDVTKSVTISADSSQSGLGAVCMQEGQPVAYASRALTTTQQAYAQIEKE